MNKGLLLSGKVVVTLFIWTATLTVAHRRDPALCGILQRWLESCGYLRSLPSMGSRPYIPAPVALKIARRIMAIQTNEVDVDYRGLAYITDRAGNGLHILEFTGKK